MGDSGRKLRKVLKAKAVEVQPKAGKKTLDKILEQANKDEGNNKTS